MSQTKIIILINLFITSSFLLHAPMNQFFNQPVEDQDPFEVKISKQVQITIAIDGVELDHKLKIGLFNSVVPITADNFYQLCVNKFYDNSPFHRIIPNFMIQGGDFTNHDGTGGHAFKYKPTDPDYFDDENFLIKHGDHVLSMANTGRNTNGSQFFITLENTAWLNGKHVVFGRLINSQQVADSITKTMESFGSRRGTTSKPVILVKCEEIKERSVGGYEMVKPLDYGGESVKINNCNNVKIKKPVFNW